MFRADPVARSPDPDRSVRLQVYALVRSHPQPTTTRQELLGFPGHIVGHADHIEREEERRLLGPERIEVHREEKNISPIWRALLVEHDVVDPGQKTGRRRVPVKVGVGNGTRMQVLSGVKAGDKIVLPG